MYLFSVTRLMNITVYLCYKCEFVTTDKVNNRLIEIHKTSVVILHVPNIHSGGSPISNKSSARSMGFDEL